MTRLTEAQKQDITDRHNWGEGIREISRNTGHARETIKEVLDPTRISKRRLKRNRQYAVKYPTDKGYRDRIKESNKKWVLANPEAVKIIKQRHIEKNKQLGLCVNCGKPAEKNMTLCFTCKEKVNNLRKLKRQLKVLI